MKQKLVISIFIFMMFFMIAGCNKKNNINLKSQTSDNIVLLSASDKDKLLVALINDKKTVLDYSGNQLYIIEDSYDNVNIMNKYVYSTNNKKSYVYNKSGDINLINGKVISISKSGFALVEKKEKEDYKKYEIIDLNTNEKIKKYDKSYSSVVSYSEYKDYFLHESDDIKELYDAKERITYDNYYENKNFLKKEGKIFENEIMPYQDNKGKVLSIKNNLYYDNNKIYDKQLKELKDLEEGNIKYIHYYNNKIFIYTNTNFVYVLDKDLEYLLEPISIENTDLAFLKDYNENLNTIINNDNIFGYQYSVQITDNAIFKISMLNNEKDKEIEIKIIDNETLDENLSYNLKIENDQDIVVTNNAVVVNGEDNNLYIINKDTMKTFKKSKAKVFSDKIISIKNKNKEIIYNIEKMKKIEAEY